MKPPLMISIARPTRLQFGNTNLPVITLPAALQAKLTQILPAKNEYAQAYYTSDAGIGFIEFQPAGHTYPAQYKVAVQKKGTTTSNDVSDIHAFFNATTFELTSMRSNKRVRQENGTAATVDFALRPVKEEARQANFDIIHQFLTTGQPVPADRALYIGADDTIEV